MVTRFRACRSGRVIAHWVDVLDRRILQLAVDQYGIISARQLREVFGISQPSIARARCQGLIVETASQVFRIASSPDSFEARCFALQLHARGEGYSSGWTAARLHGLRDAHRCRGKDGVSTMERWLETALRRDRPTQSNLERRLVEALRRCGVPAPTLQFALTLRDGEVIHLDLAWPDVRLAVEPGAAWWHGGDLAQRRDQARDRACAELGWMILRFDESMRSDLPDAARQIARIHGRRSQEYSNSVGNDSWPRDPHRNSAPRSGPPEFW